MEENVKISILLDIYGGLLTKNQYDILDDFYNNDLSLTEIAENNNITRQAVRDILKKGEKKLFEYEKEILVMEKELEEKKVLLESLKNIDTLLQNNSLSKDEIKLLEDTKKRLNNLLEKQTR